jgi:hypothetical protein
MWQRNLIANIVIGFFMLLMMGYLLMLGIFIDPIIRKILPDEDPVMIVNGLVIYFLGFDLLIRYLMQTLPTFAIESYLHLPVRKRTMVHFTIGKSVFHLLNFLPLLVFVPFALTSVLPGRGGISALSWILMIIFLILNNNFLATYFKRQLVSKPLITLLAGIVLIAFAVLDYIDFIGLSSISSLIFSSVFSNPLFIAIPVLLMIFSYSLNYFLLKSKMYPDEVIRHKTIQVQDIPRIKYLNSIGLTGDLIMLDMRLWWKHKRTKTILYMLPIFLLYGLLFYPDTKNTSFVFYLFVGTFMTGGMTMNYLMYAFSYESNHFDGILTSRIDMARYIKAKLAIGMLFTTLCFILTIPYMFFGNIILLYNTAAFLFNLGFSSYILMFLATYNTKRMDLSKSTAFNYQGIGLMNWIVPLPVFFLPVILFAIVNRLGNEYIALAAISFLGIIGLLSRKFWIRAIENNFYKRKYSMAEGFREGA